MAQQVCTCACPQTGQPMLPFWDPHTGRGETTPDEVTVTTEEPDTYLDPGVQWRKRGFFGTWRRGEPVNAAV